VEPGDYVRIAILVLVAPLLTTLLAAARMRLRRPSRQRVAFEDVPDVDRIAITEAALELVGFGFELVGPVSLSPTEVTDDDARIAFQLHDPAHRTFAYVSVYGARRYRPVQVSLESFEAGPVGPGEGDPFHDADEPELVRVREAKDAQPALAVMAAAVDTTLFQRYAKDRGRAPLKCQDSALPAQGCIELAMATDLARWLSKQSGHDYRVPTRTELAAAMPNVATAPAYAWTSTCKEVRVVIPRKAGSRAWSRVKKVFGGKPTPQKVQTRCEGNFALLLDGQGGEARAREKSASDSVVGPVREIPAAK